MIDSINAPVLLLGIDTGGTYTDGALMDRGTDRVIATYKALTTHRDLAIGIEDVIAGIRIDRPAAVKLVSVSTTLATNAIAEGSPGRGRRVALALLGYDSELVATFNMGKRLGTHRYAFFAGGHDLNGRPQMELDVPGITKWVKEVRGEVDAIAVSGYFSPLNPLHEQQAYAAIRECCDLPVVMGHQLTTKLGSIERATTATLNASLLAVLKRFVSAVRRALIRRRIEAPLMVVRGDGSLMHADFAAQVPVETIHSGPAASAMGARWLAQVDHGLVVDVGGTTTDIALVEDGHVAVNEEGARVKGYKTAVRAADMLSIPLGGDSHIHLGKGGNLAVGPGRVVPLARLAQTHPDVERGLASLPSRLRARADPTWLEYWFLLREPPHDICSSYHAQAIVALLRDGPQPVPRILNELGLFHPGQIDAGRLWQEEVLGRAGLTPTDLLHMDGRYAPWNSAAAEAAVDALFPFVCEHRTELHGAVFRQMTATIVGAIVAFFIADQVPLSDPGSRSQLGEWFLANSLDGSHPHLGTELHLRFPLIGIGAAAPVILDHVADVLHTELVLPPHHAVANAVGAVAGSVMVTEEVLVYPCLSQKGLRLLGYYVQGTDGRTFFADRASALECARAVGRRRAQAAAQRAGATAPHVLIEETTEGMDGVRIRARGVGNPRLAP